MTPKTIQIFLPQGDARGIRIAEVTTRIVQVIEVPRSLLADFLKMPESGQVAVYFLVGESADDAQQRLYVGQSGDVRSRLVSHNREKDFWERALVVISRTNSLTQTHALFLEWHCLRASREAGRFSDENGNNASKPHTPPPLEADCLEIFDTARTLLATLGFPVFEPAVRTEAPSSSSPVYYCTGSDADAKGRYTEEGFVVLAGSTGRLAIVQSMVGMSGERLRERLVASGIITVSGDRITFTKDHLFTSPSLAATAVMGRTANGWLEWKTNEGRSLDVVVRRNTP